ncbi:glutathione S-transferase family protein [Luteimonas sp. e5]
MSTAELTLYTHPMSRGRIARWMLEETGLPYRAEILEYGTGMKAPAYRAINPMGKVPAIRHGDTIITEVAAIGLYLADQVPDKRLAPPVDSRERGPYYRWISFMAPLEQMVMAKHAGTLGDPTSAGYGTEKDVLDTLEAAIGEREHLAGDGFSMADLMVAAYLGWYLRFKMIEPREPFVRFTALHAARAAARRADEIDDALLPGQEAAKDGAG